MLIIEIKDFFDAIGNKSKIFALDIGTKKIGIAISDFHHLVATPFYTIKRKKFTQDLELLSTLISENDISGLVIGLPLMLDGSEGAKCQSVRQFGRNLLKEFDIPILFWDERFSTVSAEEILIEGDVSRKKRSEIIDKIAASYILQNTLDTAKNT